MEQLRLGYGLLGISGNTLEPSTNHWAQAWTAGRQACSVNGAGTLLHGMPGCWGRVGAVRWLCQRACRSTGQGTMPVACAACGLGEGHVWLSGIAWEAGAAHAGLGLA